MSHHAFGERMTDLERLAELFAEVAQTLAVIEESMLIICGSKR